MRSLWYQNTYLANKGVQRFKLVSYSIIAQSGPLFQKLISTSISFHLLLFLVALFATVVIKVTFGSIGGKAINF